MSLTKIGTIKDLNQPITEKFVFNVILCKDLRPIKSGL